MEQTILNVQGMSCAHCVNSIESSVGQLEGVKSVEVSLSENKVNVSYDSDKVSLKEISDTIEEQGYDVV
ncbi:copper chaperone CopZ [Terribacillus saccharophilus]|uniref:copper chaperone CopZ n=1 Tax=Terribacillus saccharophilus TaxID=361277 RepID=UPI00381C8AFA